MTKLIFHIQSAYHLEDGYILKLPGDRADPDIFRSRIGEEIALGHSEVEGIWRVTALGKLAGCWVEASEVTLLCDSVRQLDPPARMATEGVALHTDAGPFLIDVFDSVELERLRGHISPANQTASGPLLLAGEHIQTFSGWSAGVGAGTSPPLPSLADSQVAIAYGHRCCFSGASQIAPAEEVREGVVVGLEAPHNASSIISDSVFATGTLAFSYRHGLIAIGDDYKILFHRTLDARLVAWLAISNRENTLYLPENPSHWPDLQAARRHRVRHGF